MARVLASLGVASLVLVATACAPTLAPPVRTIHGGAPGRLDPHDMEVGAAASGIVAPIGMGGGTVGYAARPHLTVEGGIDGHGTREGWTIGWGGIRVPWRWRLSPVVATAVDGEAGVGVGVGGRNCDEEPTADLCNTDGIPWWRRAAGGGYLGTSAALRLGPISLYTRGRLQLAGARNVPATQWASLMGGLHVHILDRADVWGGVAIAHFSNAADSATGMVSELGLAFRFDPYLGWRR